jgi:hypothetical protein
MSKYIGIKPGPSGNEGDIWYRNPNGVYVCDKKRQVLTMVQIKHDLDKGYLEEIKDDRSRNQKEKDH